MRTRAALQQEVSLETRQAQPKHSPLHTLKNSLRGVSKQFRTIRRAFVHPQVPWHAKAVVGCVVLYLVSPIQIIPTFIPIIGQMDDVLVVILGSKYLRRFVLDECEGNSRILCNGTIPASAVTFYPVPGLDNEVRGGQSCRCQERTESV